MRFRKVLSAIVVVLSLTSSVAFAQPETVIVSQDSPEQQQYQAAVKSYVENFVKDAYAPYYVINSIQLSTSDFTIDQGKLTTKVNVSLNKTLKAKSVNELPYVKGLNSKLNSLKLSRAAYVNDAEQVINDKIQDLEQYIGTPTDQNDSFRVTADIVDNQLDLTNAKFEFLNGLVEWIPATYFIPESETAIAENAEADLANDITVNRNYAVKQEASAIQPLATVKYDRLAARDYANKYTSEVTSSLGYDTSKWNPNYAWHTESGGVDCANYVSQAIYAGGIPKDSTWKPESTAWVNTGRNISNGLKQYMVDTKGYFYKTTKGGTSAGGFISAVNYSHVMFIVANDGVTMLFSAHTNDRLKASFANFSSSSYEFYYVNSSYL
ncbi:hypothetical protein AMQ84_28100 [Paenibacillus riograndensis]|uniref:Putative amidase domain-containing protein n=1 Tax=Paenibacillus riograndensis TaxID=483937 RepID=A0A132THY3_9BACL|nr:amidase domain-containing protein [Paenibacillus riograndensis]KWX70904.1 hypothetical protein AMQ84_28100 [Paenibacillus riograndensis]KWX87154.1 hypothetical protein AMQ83_14795 [Paenibacillus riograndensis]